jgi:hypothetical protein
MSNDLNTRPKSLAYRPQKLSRRWLADAQCKKLGWVMVPYDASEKLTHAVAGAFDILQTAITVKKLVVHTSLLDMIERLETALIEKLCDLASSFRRTRITRWEQTDIEVVTAKAALGFVTELLEALFSRLHTRITDYTLIDCNNPDDKLTFLELECLEEKVVEDVTKIVEGWK